MEETVNLKAVDGVLTIQDDLKDYVDRGTALEDVNMLNFFLNTYERDLVVPSTVGGPGRPQSVRVPYLEGTGHGKRCQVIRSAGHETMPNFVGDWFPRNDVPELQDFYQASMLALFTPWRNIAHLKGPSNTFKQAFGAFAQTADETIIDIRVNIQYQYKCSDSALKKRSEERANTSIVGVSLDCEELDQLHNIGKHLRADSDDDGPTETFTQSDIEREIASEFSQDDRAYVEVALNIALDAGVFVEGPPDNVEWSDNTLPAT